MMTTTLSSLPVELLAEIFTHSLPQYQSKPKISTSPLLLTRVSRLWYNVAVATPELWSTFSVDVRAEEDMIPLAAVKLWLSRSQTFPLSISVDDSVFGKPEPPRQAFYDELCQHAGRWRDVTFNATFTMICRLNVQQPLDMLERLKMGSDDDRQFVPDRSIAMFATAPRLQVVDILLDSDEAINIQEISLPWCQLTTFRGQLITTQECFFVLLQAANLVECEFRDIVLQGPATPSNASVSRHLLPHIQTLRLDGSFAENYIELILSLTLPNVKTLSLGSKKQVYTDNIVWSIFDSFLFRSVCNLTHLHFSVNNSTNEWEELVERLPMFQMLEFLELFSFNGDCNIAPLSYTFNVLLPQLQMLVFSSRGPPDSNSMANIITLLFKRTSVAWTATHNNAPLRRFEYIWKLDNGVELDEKLPRHIEKLRRRGLQVYFGLFKGLTEALPLRQHT
ncbi:hypothetical protein MIND_01002000 [Mycena indigotica]|uniref:F-box domain-containing protein n=1 Tax=Mycena indigotica TaxID=2126181 RepID=A0A8H6S946_9AGAR|nr:uncharacterized protein MIND_01002000 [Mycena indigotica]KAF7294652.1 hypothetical protein MIND_01002000 [Mycena indigotica]